MLLFVLVMSACQNTEHIDIASYAPVIDIKGQGYDQGQYYIDLNECRELGVKVQATYQAQRKKERDRVLTTALIGTVAGAAIGNNVGNNSGNATAGAVYGGLIGGAVGAEQVDYSRTIAKFGPTAVIDRCMNNRGYTILSAEGFGGG